MSYKTIEYLVYGLCIVFAIIALMAVLFGKHKIEIDKDERINMPYSEEDERYLRELQWRDTWINEN